MRLVLLFATTTLLLVSGQLQVKQQKLYSCDVTAYQEIIYQKDNLDGQDMFGPAATFEECGEKCLKRPECKAVNYIEKQKLCSLHSSGLPSSNADKSLYSKYAAVHGVITCNRKPTGPVGCGTQAPAYKPLINKNLRIINGMEAKPHSWPWLLTTFIESSRQGNLIKGSGCGSVLLRVKDGIEKSDMVVTAAHCVVKKETAATKPEAYAADKITITAGNHHRDKYEDGELQRTGAALRFHPKYFANQTDTLNDIALIKLAVPLDFTDTIRPICLPKAGEGIPVGKTCVAAGWGRNNSQDESKSSDTLQQVLAPAQDAKTCQKGWGLTYKEDMQICAGNLAGTSSTCQGDSGGMLACQNSDASWTLYGVTSFGTADKSCLAAGKPSVFARLSNYIDWITKNMNEMTSIK